MFKRRMTGLLAVIGFVGAFSVSGARAEVLTLEECVNTALENHGSAEYRLPQARNALHRAGQSVWSAWGTLLPTASHGYSYSHLRFGDQTYDPTTGLFFEIPEEFRTSTSWSNFFSFSQTLFDGGASWYRLAQSYHNRTAQRENLRAAENSLIYGVKQSYFSLLKSAKLVEVQEASVRRAEESHKTIRSKYELGSASLSEVLKAEVQLGSERLELVRRQNEVASAEARLNTILGRSVDAALDIADVGAAEPVHPPYEEAQAAGITESPSVLTARASFRSAKDEIGIARATILPSISWRVSRSYSPRERNDLLDFDSRFGTWFIGANLNINLFNGFNRKTAISNARVGVKYAREALAQTENAVALAVKQAHLGVELAVESRLLADQTEASAQEDFKLAQEKYNLGAATILDLLNAQESLTKAQNEKVNTLYDHYVAVARLENAMGRGR